MIFYKSSFKKWLKDNDIDGYGKSVVAERFIRTLKSKIYNNMIAVSKKKNVYFVILGDILVEYNNTAYRW